ncbi:MAG TPA: methyltransferase domain-containing protein, partial [Longimicrobiales bacterium]|nr:methyltransferase domain-containing protein [Longimicrobiales bacterium]
GIDCFLASRQVGPSGRVIGVDMTPEMVERARRNAASGGYENVEFRLGEIEALPVGDESVDVVISNCVLNLSPTKEKALAEAHRVLRPGGRVAISDMVSERPVPAVLQGSLDAVAACLPTQRERYIEELTAAGFEDVRIVSETPYPAAYILSDPGVQDFLARHPSDSDELRAFAGSIAGAHFEARKP